MKCYSCGNIYSEHEGTLELNNKTIGSYNIFLAKYYKCSECDVLLFPKETAKTIAIKEEEIRNNLIRKLPVEDFIVATEAAGILGITRQAFHKHSRIKKGFIYSAMIGGKRLYNKKSVQLFQKTQDGRFNLTESIVKKVEYIYVRPSTNHSSFLYTSNIENYQNPFCTEKEISLENQEYRKYIQ
ncbi:MAG: hypothetical protein HQK72_11440 [Desulfamplus sp.]|nr:hypothetical protein [Desulfamplus sp.]